MADIWAAMQQIDWSSAATTAAPASMGPHAIQRHIIHNNTAYALANATNDNTRNGSDDDDDSEPQNSTPVPTISELTTMLAAYENDFTMESLAPPDLKVPTASPATTTENTQKKFISFHNGDNQKVEVEVREETDAALFPLVKNLFDKALFTKAVEKCLRDVVRAQSHAAQPSLESDPSIPRFYESLTSVAMVLSRYCSAQEKLYPRSTDTRDSHRPILELWQRVLADLFSIQSIFVKASDLNLIDTKATDTDISAKIGEVDSQIDEKNDAISELERERIKLMELQNQRETEVRKVRNKYRTVDSALEQNQTTTATMQSSLSTYTDIRKLAAFTEANMKADAPLSKKKKKKSKSAGE